MENINLKPIKIINLIGASTFGVLLIHDNIYVRNYLWESLFKNASFANSGYLTIYEIIVVFVVFSICIAIDMLRIYLLEKPFFKLLDKITNKQDIKDFKIYKTFDNLLQKI